MTSLLLLHGGFGFCWLELQPFLQAVPFVGPVVVMWLISFRNRLRGGARPQK